MATRRQKLIDTDKDFTMCFGCGQNNPIGLKLSFQWDGKTAKAEFTPNKFHQGWSGIVHGGIITCLLDEAMGYAALFKGMNCATASIQARLRRPALVGEPLIITSSTTKKTRKVVETEAAVFLKDGTLVAEGTSKHFVINPKPGDASNRGEPRSYV